MLTRQHIRRFADASGDHNPLHLDDGFARRTPYGLPIVHGALAALMALAEIPTSELRVARALELRFPRPLMPGDGLQVTRTNGARDAEAAVVRAHGQDVARVSVTLGDEPFAEVGRGPLRARAAPRSVAAGAEDPRAPLREAWTPDLDGLRGLADELGASGVPDAMLVWLAAASYTVGMISPGAQALFASARIERAAPGDRRELDVEPRPSTSATGLQIVEARLSHEAASATLSLRAFTRTSVDPVSRRSMAVVLEPSRRLEGANVAVVGASRGLGAAIAVGLADQGASVWALHSRGEEDVRRLAGEFDAERIRSVRCDVGDEQATRRAFADILTVCGELSGLVLCAAPPLLDVPLVVDSAEFVLDYLRRSVAMVLHPLVLARPHLARDAWLVFVSSSAVEHPPANWAHYVTAKGAVERLAEYEARHGAHRVSILRPPRLRTDMTNGPVGVGAAMPVEPVAARLLEWVLAGDSGARLEVLRPGTEDR